MTTTADADRARRVVLSHPSDLSDRARDRVSQEYYLAYLGRVHEEAREGDVWQEFTDVGCCGSQLHVQFRVERVEGGPRVDSGTEIELVARPDEEMPNPWTVQNEID